MAIMNCRVPSLRGLKGGQQRIFRGVGIVPRVVMPPEALERGGQEKATHFAKNNGGQSVDGHLRRMIDD
jgi:hypothetical protein